jgi:FkbH-like protein
VTATSHYDGLRASATDIRELVADGRFEEAWRLLVPEMLSSDESGPWSLARNVLRAGAAAGFVPSATREVRLAVLGTYETAELSEHLRLACLALRIDVDMYAAPFGQLEQELLQADGPVAQFAPTHVLLAPSAEDLGFAELADDPESQLAAAESRWRSLWERIRHDLGARVVQHGFVIPDATALGHLSMRLPGSRVSLVRELDRRLAQAAGADVLLVDCERLAARIGKRRWFDPRLWFAARVPFSQEALPLLARETAAVLAGDVGLAARCLVVDLDNTLWGGVIGEDGLEGIAIGEGPDGEAYAALQDYLAALARRGLLLAVASKNDFEAAREPLDRHPAMRLRFEDFAAFVADWRPKSEQLQEIAQTLGLGLDALVFADDNPAECAEVAAALPEVSTIWLDVPPSERVRRLDACVRFELPSLSREDLERQRSYAARAQAAGLRAAATTLEAFWRSLQMRAEVRPVDRATLDRAAALCLKTNQFNLTLRRHARDRLERLIADPRVVCLTLALEDRFARHGIVGLGIVVPSEEEPALGEIDTLLLSCRVIGRTAETHLLSHVCAEARARGLTRLRGVYVRGPRNALVGDLYAKLGFTPCRGQEHCWEHDLLVDDPIQSDYIMDVT